MATNKPTVKETARTTGVVFKVLGVAVLSVVGVAGLVTTAAVQHAGRRQQRRRQAKLMAVDVNRLATRAVRLANLGLGCLVLAGAACLSGFSLSLAGQHGGVMPALAGLSLGPLALAVTSTLASQAMGKRVDQALAARSLR
jgi:hypothetical protein